MSKNNKSLKGGLIQYSFAREGPFSKQQVYITTWQIVLISNFKTFWSFFHDFQIAIAKNVEKWPGLKRGSSPILGVIENSIQNDKPILVSDKLSS